MKEVIRRRLWDSKWARFYIATAIFFASCQAIEFHCQGLFLCEALEGRWWKEKKEGKLPWVISKTAVSVSMRLFWRNSLDKFEGFSLWSWESGREIRGEYILRCQDFLLILLNWYKMWVFPN